MATVNFSVPEEVKLAFNEAFAGENKSAIIAELMRRAVSERELRRRRARAIDALLDLRGEQEPVAAGDVERAREALRR